MSTPSSQDPNQFQWPTLPQGGLRVPGQENGAQTPAQGPSWTAPPGLQPEAQPTQNPYATADPYANPYADSWATTSDPLAGTSTQWKQPPAQTVDVYNPPAVAPGPVSPTRRQRTSNERLASNIQWIGWIAAIMLMLNSDGGGGFVWILLAIFVLPRITNAIRNRDNKN